MKTILVGYDGTRGAERALERAAELARAFEAKVVVVSVATPPSAIATPGAFGLMPYAPYPTEHELGGAPQLDEALWERHRERVAALLASGGVAAEFAGVVGVPDDQILAVADQEEADLIVVGTREPGFFERLFSGSVSQSVARRAHCDVLVVHPAPSDDEDA